MIAQSVLALIAVVALGLSASVIFRSIRTANLNRQLAALYTVETGTAPEVEIAAPPGADPLPVNISDRGMTLSFMGMPDGSEVSAAAFTVPATESFHNTLTDVLPDMLKLLRSNGDTVGWLYIKGTVSLPVVYRDNQYYLTHDFYGKKNASGTLFLDENHPLDAQTQNLLIHGHSMNDGSMFGILTHYKNLGFLQQHPLITFSTLWEKETYAVFAVLQVSSKAEDAAYFNYFDHTTFTSDTEFYGFIRELQARSKFDIPVDVEPTDALLTLSTCLDDDRLVIVARRLRVGETKDELVSAIEVST